MKTTFLILSVLFLGYLSMPTEEQGYTVDESKILSHTVDLKQQDLRMFWKNDEGKLYGSFKSLRSDLEADGKKLLFAMNGGMYMENQTPLGLYIEEGETKKKLNSVQEAYGNFYMQPNGIFIIHKNNTAEVVPTKEFVPSSSIRFATQSGPMLLIGGRIHSKFRKGSSNLHIRNGVGILPDGKVLFAMSKERINFYDFATYFKQKGCKYALYLDGAVSKTYLPSKNWEQLGGKFGVIIGEVSNE